MTKGMICIVTLFDGDTYLTKVMDGIESPDSASPVTFGLPPEIEIISVVSIDSSVLSAAGLSPEAIIDGIYVDEVNQPFVIEHADGIAEEEEDESEGEEDTPERPTPVEEIDDTDVVGE